MAFRGDVYDLDIKGEKKNSVETPRWRVSKCRRRKTVLSRCNAHCWPPVVSRQADRFAGFSRLLRNHQSYSAIRSDNVAPRDTARVQCDRSLPFLSFRSSLAFPLIDISDRLHTRPRKRNLLEWYRTITLPYLLSIVAFVCSILTLCSFCSSSRSFLRWTKNWNILSVFFKCFMNEYLTTYL